MTWTVLIPIIAQYGIPLAESLFQKWTSGSVPTQADFDDLKRQAAQKSVDVMKSQLQLAGIPLDDPHAVALLKLVQ